MTSVKGAIRVCEWTRDKVSGVKRNADGVCVMSGYEELLCDGKFSVAQYVHYKMSKVLSGTQCDLVSPLSTCLYTRYVFNAF